MSCSAPTHSPRPLSPRRAKEGANRHIWPCVLRWDVPAPFGVEAANDTRNLSARGRCCCHFEAHVPSRTNFPPSKTRPNEAPLFRPAGRERGWGSEWGKQRKKPINLNIKNVLN